MKKIIVAIGLLLAATYALADCPALEYQEMKDMNTPDLTGEYCKTTANQDRYLKSSKSNSELLVLSEGKERNDYFELFKKDKESAEQCQSQSERIKRVLIAKNTSEEDLKTACQKK
ncbi:hypothetical protein [Solimicrobium silvestre]|uniref:Lipoprotein n=1 Tax=Solimicrobium silvestre TaxID=2099400 RepID=A0A2S9GY97_9BURK|nr:hypothetical protein [Solimicrobium silvestre]PRC92678.1 hypothetical protein S2091_2733 [Solimicrobium silvestre]